MQKNQVWIKVDCPKCKTTPLHIRLYSPLEAADYCGGDEDAGAVSVQTINRWRQTGWLRSLALGRGNFYTKDALDECLTLRELQNRIHEEN